MSVTVSTSDVQTAMSMLSHLYFAPILGRLIRAGVPDLLDAGPVHSGELDGLFENATSKQRVSS